jgi:outer membrane immunogenic protein
MKRLATAIAAIALIGTPALAADMAVKAPPAAQAPIPYTWTGFYAGIQFGGAWGNEAGNNNSGNDPATVDLFSGFIGDAAPLSPPRVSQSGAVGGVEAGYNWQVGSNWILGIEADFSGSGMSGANSATGPFRGPFGVFTQPFTQTVTAHQETDWFGTVRGRVGWLATPNLLLFGTGGFAYGRVSDSGNWAINAPAGATVQFSDVHNNFAWSCSVGPGPASTICFAGNSSGVRTGWTAGGGLEWLLDQHWSAKIEYLFVDLGTNTVRVVSLFPFIFTPSSFNAAFHDRFNVVRLGLNYRFW